MLSQRPCALVCSPVRMRSVRRVEPVEIPVALLAILAVALIIVFGLGAVGVIR